MTLQTERVRTLDQVRAFVEGSEAVDFMGADQESVYEFVRRALVRLDYGQLGKSDKGLVRRYLAKVTGRSRAQLTRLIGQHRETGRIEDRRGGAPAHPFERRYTRADIRLLAVVDAAMGQMSGPATRALMRRQYEMFGDGRFERLARLSNGHLYNLRRSVSYRRRRTVVGKTQATHNAIGPRFIAGYGAATLPAILRTFSGAAFLLFSPGSRPSDGFHFRAGSVVIRRFPGPRRP